LRLSLPLCLTVLTITLLIGGGARAAQAMHPQLPAKEVRVLRAAVDHYRTVAWTFDRAARRHVTPTTYSYRRTKAPDYLQWTLAAWQRHEFEARRAALQALKQRLDLRLPQGPGLHASLYRRIEYAKKLTLRLQQAYPAGRSTGRSLASARLPAAKRLPAKQQLFTWEQRAAAAALDVSRHATRLTLIGPRWLTDAFVCIHGYEGAWTADSGNGYYGGLQMDWAFMRRYGGDFLSRWGTADRWPAWAQIQASVRAYQSGRGFWPWPNTARACGLL
jgi:hypothetical protein